jgi:signal transduction histidine kinase
MEKGPLQLTHVGRLNIKRRCAHLLCLCTTIQQAEAYTIQTYDHRGDTPRWKGNDGMAVINQPGVRYPGKGLVLILLLSGLFATYLLIKPGTPQTVTLVDNLIKGLLAGVGLCLAVLPWAPGAAGTTPAQRWVPLLLCLGILSCIIGQGIWTYNENIAHLPMLFPSWADAGCLGSYLFMLLAILLLPRRPLLVQARIGVLLDGLIIMVGVVTFSWYFVLGPEVLQGANTLAGRIIGMANPLAALLLIFCLLRLMARSHDREMQPVVLLLTLALMVLVVTDSVYGYLVLHNLYATGGLLDVGWPLGYMLVGLSAYALQQMARPGLSTAPAPAPVRSPQESESIRPSSSLWRAIIPLLTVVAAVLLLVWALFAKGDEFQQPGVYLGVGILLGLLVVRQALVIQETINQNHQLRTMQRDLWARNEALQRANAQIEQQARLEAAYEQQRRLNKLKDQFILHASHELRTPLTQVYGYLELLGTFHDTLSSEKRATFTLQATQGCETLQQLIDTMLDAAGTDSHLTPPQPQELVVADLVHEVLDQFEPLQRQEHPVHLEIAEGLVVQADRQSLCRVLRNLLSNAFKYTPAQTSVQVVATHCDPVTQRPNDTLQACICVQDTGPGIPPEDIPLLFGKFVRLKRDMASSIRGTGLGLYISKQLVEAMGGHIWVESAGIVGQGSRFYFTLPVGCVARK